MDFVFSAVWFLFCNLTLLHSNSDCPHSDPGHAVKIPISLAPPPFEDPLRLPRAAACRREPNTRIEQKSHHSTQRTAIGPRDVAHVAARPSTRTRKSVTAAAAEANAGARAASKSQSGCQPDRRLLDVSADTGRERDFGDALAFSTVCTVSWMFIGSEGVMGVLSVD